MKTRMMISLMVMVVVGGCSQLVKGNKGSCDCQCDFKEQTALFKIELDRSSESKEIKGPPAP